MHQFVVEFKSLSSHDKLDVIKIKAGDVVISHRFSRVGESCQLTGSNPVQTCLRSLVRQCLRQYRCRWNFARLYSVIWTFDLRRRRIVNVTQGHLLRQVRWIIWSAVELPYGVGAYLRISEIGPVKFYQTGCPLVMESHRI